MKFATTIRGPGGARAGCAALIAVALLTFGCPARAADAEVTIDNFTFSPQTLTIKAGTDLDKSRRHPAYRHFDDQSVQIAGARHRRQLLIHLHDRRQL